MANKVINIGNSKSNLKKNDETYVDISMISDINLHNRIVQEYKTLQNSNIVIQNNQILINENGHYFIITTFQKEKKVYENFFKLNKNIDVRAVQNSIDNIFSWVPGERILNPEFGNNLYKYLYEGITSYNEELIVAEIKNCVLRWEPRVNITKVTNVSNISDTEDNTIILNIEYNIKGLEGIIYNKLYKFNRTEE